MTPPEGRVARIHEFATDMAIGFDEGAWPSENISLSSGDEGVTFLSAYSDESGELKNLASKWSNGVMPSSDTMSSVGYFVSSEGYGYSLSEKALRLADEPAALLNVFISYKRDKSSEFALLLHSRIQYETNATPFVDHNLKPGDEWHAKLEQKVADCDAFICLLAPGTLCSPFVQKEINWALTERENNNRLIIPVWHKGYVIKQDAKCDKISERFNAVEVDVESAKGYNSAVDEVLNRLGYSTAFLERRRR